MRRHRLSQQHSAAQASSSEDDDDDDAFTALSKKQSFTSKTTVAAEASDNNRKRSLSSSNDPQHHQDDNNGNASNVNSLEKGMNNNASAEIMTDASGNITNTSSNKRHHNTSTARAAKMESLLQELQSDMTNPTMDASGHYGPQQQQQHHNKSSLDGSPNSGSFVPLKKGSFVEAGEELLTTNIFVGNLDPITTEEELTDLFRQFGEQEVCLLEIVGASIQNCCIVAYFFCTVYKTRTKSSWG